MDWTDGRKKAFITSVLRSGSRRWPPKYQTLNEAKTEKKINPKTGRLAQHYLCAICNEQYPQKEVEVDHIEPVVDKSTGFANWDTFINRLFCSRENLQLVCKGCHKIKTNKEKKPKK